VTLKAEEERAVEERKVGLFRSQETASSDVIMARTFWLP